MRPSQPELAQRREPHPIESPDLATGNDDASGTPETLDVLEVETLMLNLEASLRVHERAHFFSWTQGLLQSLIRHQALICALRDGEPLSFRADSFSVIVPDPAIFSEMFLRDAERTWLDGLEPTAVRDGVELFHGSPRDPVWDYVLSDEVALASFARTSEPLILVGHSHVALAISLEADQLGGGLAPAETTVALDGPRWLLNPGSVGQPRDGDPHAAWLLIEPEARRATFRRVPYAIDQTQAEIHEQGLPPALASRLSHGI